MSNSKLRVWWVFPFERGEEKRKGVMRVLCAFGFGGAVDNIEISTVYPRRVRKNYVS